MKVYIHRNLDAVEPLWREIQANGCCYGFQTYDWVRSWFEVFKDLRQVQPLVVQADDKSGHPAMLLPLCVQNHRKLASLTFMGNGVSDYNAPILRKDVSPTITRTSFLEVWRQTIMAAPCHDFVHVPLIPETLDGRKNPLLFLDCTPMPFKSHAAVLGTSWEDYYDRTCPNKHRGNARRQRKRLMDISEVRFVVAETAQEIATITSAMIEQRSRRSAHWQTINTLSWPGHALFYHNAAQSLAPLGLVHVSALMVADEIVATHWGLVHDDRFYVMMPTFASGVWAPYSCGLLLMEELLKWCIEQGLRICDFTYGDESYKQLWCNSVTSLYTFLKPRSLLGNAYCVAQSSKEQIRRRHPALFHILRRVKHGLAGRISDFRGS